MDAEMTPPFEQAYKDGKKLLERIRKSTRMLNLKERQLNVWERRAERYVSKVLTRINFYSLCSMEKLELPTATIALCGGSFSNPY